MTPDLPTDINQKHPSEAIQQDQKQLFPTKVENNIEAEANKCSDTSAKNKELKELFTRLWTAADELRANSALRSTQYSTPVLGIIFLRYADYKFEEATNKLQKEITNQPIRKIDYLTECVYLTEKTRYEYLLKLPEGAHIGLEIDKAMRSIETENDDLKDVLPKIYSSMEDRVLVNLLKLFHAIPTALDRDIFGKIYEYFLGEFAKSEGQRGGEFYTPTSLVRLIVEVIEPYQGRILDPACGSGGMFVQSAEFVKEHLKNPYNEISIFGQEKTDDTVRLCKMNLAIHGLSGDIKQGNTYYEDLFNMRGQFDFVMANPPFNVNNVDKEAIKDDPRFPFGLPTTDNANYVWIEIFYSMLNENGKSGFVMANIANDASFSELEIRKKLIENGTMDVVISVAPNFFHGVALAVTLWFFNRAKEKGKDKKNILFIDARRIFKQIDRAHREFTLQQIEFISNIVRLFRNEECEMKNCSKELTLRNFSDLKYKDVKGLCKVATIEQIERENWSLSPGRYVGAVENQENIVDFQQNLRNLYSQLESLNTESNEIEKRIMADIRQILGEK